MTRELYKEITDPLVEIISKLPGIVYKTAYIDIANVATVDLMLNVTDTLRTVLNCFDTGHHKWSVTVIGTDTPSHLFLKARFPLKGFSSSDFKIEVDYKICIFKMHV